MKSKKPFYRSLSFFKAQWLRKGLVVGLVVALGVINYGCKKEKDQSDEYYVKYILSSTTIYSGGKLNVTISTETTDSMAIVVNTKTTWETIIGPVSKGFKANLKAVAAQATHNQLKLYTEIHVSKNDSPFTLKEINGSDIPRNIVEISYTIDY